MKKAVSLLLVFILLLSLAACSLSSGKDNKNDPAASADDIDPTTPVLSIGDESVTYAVYKALYESYVPYMQASGYDPLENVSSLESFQDWITESLAKDLVVLYQAKTSGFTLTDEQRAELSEQTESELKELSDTYHAYAEEDYADDPSIPVESYFENYIANVSKMYTGTEMTWDEYKQEYAVQAERSYIIQAYKDEVCTEFGPSESDISSWYESQYNSNKTSYQDNPGKYKLDEEYYELYKGVKEDAFPILYTPEGYSRMMHIIVTPQGELSDEYTEHTERMDEIKKEYGELAFEDALSGRNDHAAEMTDLITEYNELKAETDKEFETYSAAAKDKIDQAYAALRAGQPFAEVMLEYTEDKDVVGDENGSGCETFQKQGQLISLEHTSARDWSEGIKQAFKGLAKGQYSEVFADGGSYHIVYYASDEAAGDTPLDAVHSEIEAVCRQSAQNAQWEAIVEEWLNDAELKKNESLIRSLGMDEVNKE